MNILWEIIDLVLDFFDHVILPTIVFIIFLLVFVFIFYLSGAL